MNMPRLSEAGLRWFLPRALSLVVAATLPFIAYSLMTRLTASRLFLVEDVTISGAEHTPEAEILEAAGLARARNILTLDGAAIDAGLERHPWVRSAEVEIDFRDRSVAIAVEERTLAGITMSDVPTLVDAYGETIRQWRPGDGLEVPVLVTAAPGAPAADVVRLLDVAARVAGTERATASPVAEIQDLGGRGYRILLRDGFELVVASSEVDRRISRLDAALDATSDAPSITYALADGADPDRIVVGTGLSPNARGIQR